MNRRSLLALLGLGSAGSAAVLFSDDLESLVSGDTETGQKETTPTQTPDAADSSWDWGGELQSRLDESPSYGDISYASSATTTSVRNSEMLTEVAIEPADTDGDLFRFTASSREELRDFADLVDAAMGLSSDYSFGATLDDVSVEFTGGQAAIGPFVAATASHPARPEVVLVRADREEQLPDVVASVQE